MTLVQQLSTDNDLINEQTAWSWVLGFVVWLIRPRALWRKLETWEMTLLTRYGCLDLLIPNNFLDWLSRLGSGYLIWEHPPKMQTRCVCIHLLAYENFSGWIHEHPVPSVANMDKKISYFIYPCSENNVTPDMSPSLGLTDVLTLFKPCAVFFFIQSTNQKLTDTYLAVNRIKCGGIFMSGHASRSSHLPLWLTHTIQCV